MDSVTWLITSLLLSLRIAPVLVFAPPFTLFRIPSVVRLWLAFGVGALIVAELPVSYILIHREPLDLLKYTTHELFIGALATFALQSSFAALYFAGRALDIQSGFGLALLIDPTTRSQTPLIGTLLAYLAGASFFSCGGPYELLHIIRLSVEIDPIDSPIPIISPARIASALTLAFSVALSITGGVMVCITLIDVAIALLSRTVPQINVLIFGLQVKALLILVTLPVALGISGAAMATLTRLAFEFFRRSL